MTGIFGLVGRLIKKKFRKSGEFTLHERYLILKLEIEEMALAEGYRFKELYLMGEVDSYCLLGQEKHNRLVVVREEMSELFFQLEPHERAHHALGRGDGDLF